MKTHYKFFLTLTLLTSIGCAQKIEYSYSPSGNRTMRKYNVSTFRVAKKDSAASAKEFSEIVMQEGISVFPNPTSNSVVLTINEYNAEETNNLTVIDIKGSTVMSQKISSSRTEFDVSNLANGIYYINLVKNKKALVYKLVKVE